MAKLTGNIEITGRIGDVLFYRLGNDIIVRQVSGFTTKKLLNDSKYELSRQNASEFGRISSTGKQLREALKDILPRSNNLTVCNVLVQQLRKVLNCDLTHARGQRHLADAIATPEGLALMNGYDFNPDALLKTVLHAPFVWNADKGTVTFDIFKMDAAVIFPVGADFVGFRLHQLRFDFETMAHNLVSSTWQMFAQNSRTSGFTLATSNVTAASGVRFVLLELQFYNDDSSSFLPCEDRSKVVTIINVPMP